MQLHHWLDCCGGIVIGASVLHTILPPYEQFNDWPRFQGRYKFALIFIQAIAINGRKAMMNLYPAYAGAKLEEKAKP